MAVRESSLPSKLIRNARQEMGDTGQVGGPFVAESRPETALSGRCLRV